MHYGTAAVSREMAVECKESVLLAVDPFWHGSAYRLPLCVAESFKASHAAG